MSAGRPCCALVGGADNGVRQRARYSPGGDGPAALSVVVRILGSTGGDGVEGACADHVQRRTVGQL